MRSSKIKVQEKIGVGHAGDTYHVFANAGPRGDNVDGGTMRQFTEFATPKLARLYMDTTRYTTCKEKHCKCMLGEERDSVLPNLTLGYLRQLQECQLDEAECRRDARESNVPQH